MIEADRAAAVDRRIKDLKHEDPREAKRERLNLRKIGGSDAAAILGVDPFGKGPFDVYLRIVEGHSQPASPKMKKGKIFEHPIARWWAEERNAEVLWMDASYEPADREWQRVTPDLRVISIGGHAENAIGDVKRYDNARAFLGTPGTDQVTAYELVQLTVYMEALQHMGFGSVKRGFLIVHDLDDDELLEYVVPYNPELAAMIVGELERFWFEHVVPKNPPEISGSNNTRSWLEQKYPTAKKPARPANETENLLAYRWRELNKQKSAIDDEIDVIRNKMRDSIGDAAKVAGDWGSVSWTDIAGGPVSYVQQPYRKLAPYFRKV